jgi:uncharacterized protein (TIGR02300 family)
MMDRADRGTKVTCTACGIRFYDLNRPATKCPICGAEFKPRARVASSRKVAPDRTLRQAPRAAAIDPEQSAGASTHGSPSDDPQEGDGPPEIEEPSDMEEAEAGEQLPIVTDGTA